VCIQSSGRLRGHQRYGEINLSAGYSLAYWWRELASSVFRGRAPFPVAQINCCGVMYSRTIPGKLIAQAGLAQGEKKLVIAQP
jgi:hypothetical protein